MAKRVIYMDHAATTAVDPRVVEAMLPYWTEQYGNPSSIYRLGRQAHAGPRRSARTVAEILHAEPERDLFHRVRLGERQPGHARRGLGNRSKGRHIITSPIEHHAVGHTCAAIGARSTASR